MKAKFLIILILTTIISFGQKKKTANTIDQQVIAYLNKFEKLDKYQQRIEANKLVAFLNNTDPKTKGIWLLALQKYDKTSVKKKAEANESSETKSDSNSIIVSTFSSIPSDFEGCSHVFSINKEALKAEKFVYFDDMGTTAIIAINGESIILKKHSSFIEGEDEIIVYSNEVFSAYVHLKKYLGDSSTESQIYTAELVVKDKKGNVVKAKIYGEGGC